jgi:XTP/dITP diphosphohydrolase
LQALLQDAPFALQIAPTDLPAVAETGLTFIENALLKARSAAKHTGKAALADDSGLVVPYLNGAPGIYSARFAGYPVNFQNNIAKLFNELQGVSADKRGAYFYSCIVLLRHADDPQPVIAEGIWQGKITLEPKGEHGFGYDPVFWVEEKNCSAAELSAAEKNKISHRGLAIQQLREKLKNLYV